MLFIIRYSLKASFFFALINLATTVSTLAQDNCTALECHGEMSAAQSTATHACSVCHIVGPNDFPSKNHELSFVKEGKALCLDCHREFEKILEGKLPHEPFEQGECMICHDLHQSNNTFFLAEESTSLLCFNCHEGMEEKIHSSKYLHGPVEEGDCIACHNPHASNYDTFLIDFFPTEFYFPYGTDHYALCFGCHSEEVATEEFTEIFTDFRNGDFNLHFLHVNREKGRSCKACHEIHAGNQEMHIANEVPYGKNGHMLSIKYTKTDTGGSCEVGCHKDKSYDRNNLIQDEVEQSFYIF
jgi:predicted CXXCH cytochrome family protein